MFSNKKLLAGLIFGLINFGGLALGAYLMADGPQTEWYANLNKAPWTPPGWVFGLAWTIIMILFTLYLTALFETKNSLRVFLFLTQVILNVSWNYIFFNQHLIGAGLVVILLLTALIFYFFFTFKRELKKTSYLLLPYMIWLCIATSLNIYILVHN